MGLGHEGHGSHETRQGAPATLALLPPQVPAPIPRLQGATVGLLWGFWQ